MEFRILGPLEVRDGERRVPVGGAKVRSLLAVLPLDADRVVATARLVEELWGENAPVTAERQLVPGYVHALRKELGKEMVVTRPPGYCLRLDSHALDLLEFERLVERARGARPEQAVLLYRRALALWRGEPLADVRLEGPARSELARLGELEPATRVELIDVELGLGGHARLIAELEALSAAHPFQERLHAQLMLALYRSGRQVDALEVYRRVQERLSEQLGLQPGQALRELQAAILRQDEHISLSPDAFPSAPPPRVADHGRSAVGEVPSREVLPVAPAGERRIVSVLLGGVTCWTPIAETIGAERSGLLLDEVVGLMRGQVELHGGTVAPWPGAGLLAVFGAPVAHEDDSKRAVRAAVAIREAIADYSAEVAAAYGLELHASVAVDTGQVVVAAGEALPPRLDDAHGIVIAIARLRTLGDLVVGEATARQVAELFELEQIEDPSTDPAAFRVASVRARPAGRVEPPLVGRDRELAVLSDALDGVVEGSGAIVVISGEPGIGKSRLVAELRERFQDRVRFLAGHAVPYADAIPYWPVREQLRGWLGLGASDSETRARIELHAELARTLTGEAADAYPFLATLLGLTLEPEHERRIRELARDGVRRETFYWLYQLASALARERPLCLVFEDLHWSDEATLSLLDELLLVTEHSAVAVLVVHRNDPDHPAWHPVDLARRRHRDLFVELDVEPLPDADARSLAEADAGGDLSDELADALAERAGGNPYFIGEAIRDLRERNALERRSGRLVLAGEAAIPGAVQEALQARLGRLDGAPRELISTAAVIGRSFGLALLEHVLPRTHLVPALSELQALQLVVAERGGAAPEYRFRHGLVQEVAYRSLLETRRRELHLLVGEALLELHRDSPSEVYGLLARHFAEADDVERAVEYLLKAGDAARAVYADQEATELYQRALDFMERAERPDPRARETLLRIGLTQQAAFDYPAANEAFRAAFAQPSPAVRRLEPAEPVTWAVTAGWPVDLLAPGLANSDLARAMVGNLFRGLVALGRDLEIEPDLAERFTVSDDGRSYRFTLRRNARWSDGAPVTAHDFAFTFARSAEDDLMAAAWLKGVHTVALDKRTLEIRLPAPQSHVLHVLGLTEFFAWPRHVYERRGPNWHRDIPLVGSGPFVLTARNARPDARTAGRITLTPSPTWYGPRGNVGEVTILLEPSPEAAGERWRSGDYDLMYELLARLGRVDVDGATIVQRMPGGFTDYLGLDARRPPLDDVRIRRAVAHAIDRRALVADEGRIAAVTGGLVPPSMPGHSHRIAPAFDRDRARALLREAGHPGGRGLEEIVLAHFGIQQSEANTLAAQLEAVGIRARSLPAYSNAALEAAIRERANAHIWSWGADSPDPAATDPSLRSIPGLYRDERLERVIARARSLRDQDERLHAYREFERLWIGEHAALVPLAYRDRLLWRRPWITGMWVNAFAWSTFAEAVVSRPGP